MMKTKFKLLTLSASLLAAGMVMSSQSQAGAYALSSVVITNGRITVTGGAATLGVTSSATSTTGTPAPMTNPGDVQFGGPGDAPVNAAAATQGVMVRADETVAGNVYTPFGFAGNTAYSWADSNVVSVQSNGTDIEIRNAAEGWIPGVGNANSGAENSSTSSLTSFTLDLGGPATLAFEFMADPLGRVMLADDAGVGSKAEANFDNNFTITAVEVEGVLSGTEVFNWTPNGVVDQLFEISDAENLNGTIGTTTAGDSIDFSPGVGLGFFSAVTGTLAAGRYEFTLNTDESQFVIQNQVPEPATLALVGLGMLGMGFAGRRRRHV